MDIWKKKKTFRKDKKFKDFTLQDKVKKAETCVEKNGI